ncbi:MAG: polyphosphate kinase 1 [Anaerolineaceae bacterium]|nr:polyphosphate kinase 1 [Anaerolineaceae bacterium]
MDNEKLPELTPENYINRELSWLEFNRRVLAQAQDPSLPLLERVKFLAIFGTNLDEFYMVRVASTHNRKKVGVSTRRPDGYQPAQLLAEIRDIATETVNLQRATMREVFSLLQEQGICITAVRDLEPQPRQAIREFFHEQIFPVLTPLAVDHARPFPFISNLSLNLAVWLHRGGDDEEADEFVRLKIPDDVLPRLIALDQVMRQYAGKEEGSGVYLWLEDIIAANLDLLFPGMKVMEASPFRVTRNADIDYEYEEDNLLDISTFIETSVRERRFGSVVRLSVPEGIHERTLQHLIKRLEVNPGQDVYPVDGALGAGSLFQLAGIDRPELKDPVYTPRVPVVLQLDRDIFSAIRQGDILLHHPYDSFLPVEDFFRQAARDPDVLAIKTTLYRVGKMSPVVQALLEARDHDKQVAVLVELKARFDEENNLEWARALEHNGVHVTYGVEELPVKTHAKVALVVRREGGGVRRYLHLGTGNYNATTARIYGDLGLLTCNPDLADDVTRLFNRLTGYAPSTAYKRLLVAPEYLQKNLIALIDNEIVAAQNGKPARLIFKMNGLEEDRVIQKLYQASQAGVQVDLIVRGLCCLRPGVPGFSENIRVISIIGRFLEHSRIYYFQNAPMDKRIYLGSADLMRRNLLNRVEVVFPILDTRIQNQILRILETNLSDNYLAWELQPDDTYYHLQPGEGEPVINSQAIFMEDSAGLDRLP